MVVVVGVLLALITLVMVGAPLVRGRAAYAGGWEFGDEPADEREDETAGGETDVVPPSMETDKEQIFTSLNELEFDYRTKKLSEGDYLELKDALMRQAVDLLQREEIEEGAGPGDSDELSREFAYEGLEAGIEEELLEALEQEIDQEIETEVERDLGESTSGRTAQKPGGRASGGKRE